jgi:YHS domain-containing protein
MLTILRIAAILFILWLVVRYIKLKFVERLRELFGGENGGSAGGGEVAEMVRDPVCGSYISIEDAVKEEISGEERYFCSKECAEKFSGPGKGFAGV